MNKYFYSLIAFFFIAVSVLFLPVSTQAKVITSANSVVVEEDEVIEEDLFVTGESVVINGTVDGDVYAAGGNIEITGNVTGDILAAGGNIFISGTIGQDVRIAGGSIVISGAQIGKALSAAGGTITIDTTSSIGGSLTVAGGTVTNRAPVGRDVLIGAGSAVLNAPVSGEVLAGVSSLQLGSNASISGDLRYPSTASTNFSDSASISGTVTEITPDQEGLRSIDSRPEDLGKAWFGANSAFKLWSYLSALVIGAILLHYFPKTSLAATRTLEVQPLKSALWGLLALLLAGPLFIVLLLTFIGIPLAFILLMLFMISLYLTKLVVGLALGRYLQGQFGWDKLSAFMTLALGMGIYYIFQLVPFFGGIVSFLGTIAGLGAIYIYTKTVFKKKR